MIKKRLILFTVIALLGGILFVPYSTESWVNSFQDWLILPIGSAVVVLLFGWLGLKISDKIKLPMPILRKWENNEKVTKADWKILLRPAIFGAFLAIIIVLTGKFFDPLKNPGTLLMRVITAPWAAIVTEVISHLFVMSLIILLLKNKWAGILISSVIFVLLFHLQGVEKDTGTTIYLVTGNFAGSTLTGWLFSKYGFESAVICHAVMHLILLAIN
jgi:predicted MFS family arabinose efflux permease